MLCLDGAYTMEQGRPRFRRVPPPTPKELEVILSRITERIARHLERRGLLKRDLESSHLNRAPGEDAALEILQGHPTNMLVAEPRKQSSGSEGGAIGDRRPLSAAVITESAAARALNIERR